MSAPPFTLLVLLLAASFAAAQSRRINVPIGPHDTDGTLHLYLFDPRLSTLKVIDQGGPERSTYRDLNAAMEANGCEAGCNGGPEDKDGNPLGLVIADGKRFGRPAPPELLETSGVLLLNGVQPQLGRASDFFSTNPATPRQLIQSGPLLIVDGKVTPGLDNRRIARRTFVLTDGHNRWAIGYAPATSLHKLAAALADPTTFRDFNVATALTLGGGSSSGIWIKREHGPLYLKETGPVRTFLGLVRK